MFLLQFSENHGERSDLVPVALSFLRKAHSAAGDLRGFHRAGASPRPRFGLVFCFLARVDGDIGRTVGLWEELCAAWRHLTVDRWGWMTRPMEFDSEKIKGGNAGKL